MTMLLSSRLSMIALQLVTAVTTLAILTGCNSASPNMSNITAVTQTSTIATQMSPSPAVKTVVGDYASEGYDKRTQGYDWIGVMVRANGVDRIDIKVRSRNDIKKPSCRFDGTATLMGQDNAHGVIFQTTANDSVTFLQFKDGKLTIDNEDKYALNYFCSGGATLAGDYQKLSGALALS